MGAIKTEEDVYEQIKAIMFHHYTDDKLIRLKGFVHNLFDHNLKSVEPYDEIITSHIRIIFYIGNWYQIITEYKKQGFDILNDDFDLSEVSDLLFQYVLNPESYEKKKTRA